VFLFRNIYMGQASKTSPWPLGSGLDLSLIVLASVLAFRPHLTNTAGHFCLSLPALSQPVSSHRFHSLSAIKMKLSTCVKTVCGYFAETGIPTPDIPFLQPCQNNVYVKSPSFHFSINPFPPTSAQSTLHSYNVSLTYLPFLSWFHCSLYQILLGPVSAVHQMYDLHNYRYRIS